MTYFESLDFVYRLIFARFDLTTWIWAIVTFCASLFILHLAWGRAWNKQWTFFKLPSVAIMSIVIAALCGAVMLTWLAANRSVAWLELQRTELTRQFTDSGTLNRRIFRAARERMGGGDASAAENALVLRNERDALTLAMAAATDITCPLTPSGPLGPGAPCRVRDPASVADEVVRGITVPSYPIVVSPQNPWIKAAVTLQLQEALEYATTRLRAGMTELEQALIVLMIILLSVQILSVPIAAVSDIRVHPSA